MWDQTVRMKVLDAAAHKGKEKVKAFIHHRDRGKRRARQAYVE